MIPSFVKRISKSLSFGGAANQANSSSNDASPGTLAAGTSDSSDVTGIGALRRQATKELQSEEESGSKGKVTSRSSVSSVMTSSIVKVMSRLSVTSQGSLRQTSQRSAKAPSRLVQEDDAGTLLTKTPSKSPSRSVSKQLSKKQQASLAKKSSKTGSIQKSPSRQGSLSKIPSKQGSLSKTPSKQGSLSKIPSKQGSLSKTPSKQGSLSKTPSKQGSFSKTPSKQGSFSKTPSRQGSLSKTPSKQGSLSKTLSKQGSLSKTPSRLSLSKTPSKQNSLSKTPSLSRSGSKGSMKQRASVKTSPAKKTKPSGKQLWFPAGSYLTVRNEEGGFYLSRALNNIYNTTKSAKIRWLSPKTGRKKKRGSRKSIPATVDDDAYELVYQDELDPTSVLMEVAVERKGTSFFLDDEDKQETERLLQVAEDVELGKLDKNDIGEDVEEVVLVEYEPPAKRRKLQSGTPKAPKDKTLKEKKPRLKKTTSQKERDKAEKAKDREEKKQNKSQKKPRLKKTTSQKERDKAEKAKDREEKKQKKKEAAEARKRKSPKKEDTTLHPNPSVKVLEKDPLWETNTHMPYVSKYANSKLAFRAVQLNDMKMLKKLLKDPERIHCVDHYRCMMLKETPIVFAIEQGNTEAMDLLGEDMWGVKFKDRRTESQADRMLLSKLGTGSYNYRSLGVSRIRPLMASRGAREGNNALTKDKEDMDNFYGRGDFLTNAMTFGASKEFLLKLMNNWEPIKSDSEPNCNRYITTFLRTLPWMLSRGFNETAGEIFKRIQSAHATRHIPSFTWKVLVAKDVSELPSIPPSSIDLNTKIIKGFSMIHVAASNPNTDVLEKVLKTDPNVLVSDAQGMRPIHIAAGCTSPAPLQLLLNKGASPFDANKDGDTALHFAIQAGRTKNVEILLKLITDSDSRFVDPTAGRPNGGVNRANKESYSPLHLACLGKHLDMVKLLVKHGANLEVKTSLNNLSVFPLMCAAGVCDLGIVRYLVDAGATVEIADRVGRTALMHAAMNGATSVISYLLNIGASPNRKDTSGNTPLHYAAAYGWYFSVKLLLESGANPAVSNDWATTPLSVAYLKGHQGIVSLLLEDDRVDVNFPNESGETLLLIACSSDKEKELLEQIRYLIEEKGADCSIVDKAGKTPLHNVALANVYTQDTYEKEGKTFYRNWTVNKEVNQVVLDIAKLMVENGCDVTLRDARGYTPAMKALRMRNIALAQYLVENGSPIFSSLAMKEDTRPYTLLHAVAADVVNNTSLGDVNSVITFLAKTWTVKGVKKTFTKELCEMAQTYDGKGRTPLLTACDIFSKQIYYTNQENAQEEEAARWENGRNFLKNLVHVAKSDVNVTNRPVWRPFGERQGDPSNKKDYLDEDQAQWSPVFYMVEATDLFVDKNKEFDHHVKGTALKYFLGQGAKVNIYDLEGNTPLTLALMKNKDTQIVQMLIKEGGADVDMCQKKFVTVDSKLVTYKVPPICLVAGMGWYDKVTELLTHKVDVNAVDEEDNANVLHKLCSRPRNSGPTCPLMEKLLKAGIDPDACDKDDRTALHLLVNSNPGKINDSFEEEMLLISKKADLTIQDCLGRIPLHYLFVKIGRNYDSGQFDPVDLCKLLVKSTKPAALNTTDKHGRTPLHYAACRGASICCMYLMQKSAKPNQRDNDGNTPLSLAVLRQQDSCGSILIQNGADLLSPVVHPKTQNKEEDKDVPPEWKWKPLTFVKTPKEEREVPLFQEAIKQGLVGVSFLILEWPVEKSGVTLVDAVEMAVKNSQINVALRLLSTVIKGSQEVCAVREKNRNLLHVLALNADPDRDRREQEKLVNTLLDKGVKADAKDKYNCTPLFYAAYNKNWKLAEILAALPGVLNVKAVDSFNRNLIAVSMWNCFFTKLPAKLWDWLEIPLKKGTDINKTFEFPLMMDVFGTAYIRQGTLPSPDFWQSYPGQETTPFIFVLHCKDFTFTHNFLQWGANPNLPDGDSLTPLIHAVKLNSVKHVKQLLKYDYDPDVDDRDPMKPLPPQKAKAAKKKNLFRLKKMASVSSESDSGSSYSSDEEQAEEKKNNPKKEKEYKAVKKTSPVNLNSTDDQGWTALHYVACCLELGTFDNDELVFVLGKAGAKLGVKNSDGETPLDIALRNNAPRVAAMLQTLMGVDKKHQKQPVHTAKDHRAKDGVLKLPDYHFHADADKQLGGGEEEMEQDQPYEAGVSEYCQVSGDIARDEEQDLPYEVLMTKCDALRELWSMYNFYQIQLVHQTSQNLYVLFTRWGRIGDSGQYQHTPFQTKDDAVKEFCKIFRAKSGNKWEDVKNFEKKPRKYRLVPAEDRRSPTAQKKMEFDFKTAVKSALPENILRAMKIMVDVEKMQTAYRRDINVDTDILPFGSFSRKRLLKAKELIDEMGPLVSRIAAYREDKESKEEISQEKMAKFQEDCEKVAVLSSDYYQLIPRKGYAYEKLPPLDRERDYQKERKIINNLLDFEVSTKMMLGAMFRKKVVHPLDYIYSCVKCKLELMEQDDPMTQYILRYAFSTGDRARIEGVYKVEREGEEARFQKCGNGNRRLLWHGTRVGNITSILHRGLVAAPLDAGRTGERFGQGIYFSDAFSKSDAYSDVTRDSSGFILLCEVALGNEHRLTGNDDEPKQTAMYNSTVVEGERFPDPAYDVRLPSGEIIPLGDIITERYVMSESGDRRIYKNTDSTEYIVSKESQVCIRYLVQYRKH